MIAIREIEEEKNFKKAYPVMSQLRTQLSEEEFLNLLEPMRKQGYRLIALL
jgi:hypothetical protein